MSLAQGLGLALLRRLDAEVAHDLGVRALAAGLGPRQSGPDDPVLATTLAGLDLPNCIGLAAGFDKHAQAHRALLAAGFGFVECGTVTPLPQAGNPRPRLFRLAEDRAVINRYGFNSVGLKAFAANLARRPPSGVVGANIGANKETADRVGDYVTGLNRLWPLADYFTVNVSSPNTPGLRNLQARAAQTSSISGSAKSGATFRNTGLAAPARASSRRASATRPSSSSRAARACRFLSPGVLGEETLTVK